MALLFPLQIPESFASPDERAAVRWVWAQCCKRCPPRKMHPPLVERRVFMHPAKSVST